MQQWSQADLDRHFDEVKTIRTALAAAMDNDLPVDSPEVRELIRRLHVWVGRGWNSTLSRHAFNLMADVYAEHPDFRERYESCRAGLADYLAEAIRAFADRELA
jgi:hypothetical protein